MSDINFPSSYGIFQNPQLAYIISRTKIERNIFQMLSYSLDTNIFKNPIYKGYKSTIEDTIDNKRADMVIYNEKNEVEYLFEGKQSYSHECPLQGKALKDFKSDLEKIKKYSTKTKYYYLASFVHYQSEKVPKHYRYSNLITFAKNTYSVDDVKRNTIDWIREFYTKEHSYQLIDISEQEVGFVDKIPISLILGLIKIK